MNTTNVHKKKHTAIALWAGILLAALVYGPAQATTITIGKGTGIVWEGLPFNVTFTGPYGGTTFSRNFPLAAVSDQQTYAMAFSNTTILAGYRVIPLTKNGASTGVGLIPRVTATVSVTRRNGPAYPDYPSSFTGTIGLPKTQGYVSDGSPAYTFEGVSNKTWALNFPCITLTCRNFFSPTYNDRTVTLSGTWVMVADGTQRPVDNVSVPAMYAVSETGVMSTTRGELILPNSINLRISTLRCDVSAPTLIPFGQVGKNLNPNSELSSRTITVGASCDQEQDSAIDADVNMQFQATSGLYQGNAAWLQVNQGAAGTTAAGAYITGEISGGATGSGACGANSGIRFDSSPHKIGAFAANDYVKYFSNQITWRLCSAGSQLTSGEVNAAAEMMVTFN